MHQAGRQPCYIEEQKAKLVVRSSAEAKYRAVAKAATDLVWMKSFLSELWLPMLGAMKLCVIMLPSMKGQSILSWKKK